jgi:hypothetical protein
MIWNMWKLIISLYPQSDNTQYHCNRTGHDLHCRYPAQLGSVRLFWMRYPPLDAFCSLRDPPIHREIIDNITANIQKEFLFS